MQLASLIIALAAAKQFTTITSMSSMQLLVPACLAACLLAACVPCVRSQSCNLNNAELLRQRRMRTLRTSIMAQLGLNGQPTPVPTSTPNVTSAPPNSEAVLETYRALRSASASLERERERKCHSEDFFAKPITSFVGSMTPEGNIVKVCRCGVQIACCCHTVRRSLPTDLSRQPYICSQSSIPDLFASRPVRAKAIRCSEVQSD